MITATDTDRSLKARHRAMWALGDYPAVATDLIADLGPVLVAACHVGPGDTVLDVAAGSGNAAIPAALAGGRVIASDLTPELLAVGQRLAASAGAELRWEEGDVEALPYAAGSFDVVMSCVGVMFAPHHQDSADELLRVCRPGGTIGLISWTPEGFVGQLFAAMKPFAAAAPPGAQPPPLWGNEEHVSALFGAGVTNVRAQRQRVPIGHFPTAGAFRDYFKSNYGPTVATYKLHADDPGKTLALDAALDELARRYDLGNGAMEWEYLLYTATRS